jgi:hypothetical protein
MPDEDMLDGARPATPGTAAVSDEPPLPDEPPRPEEREIAVAFTPRQIMGGFALLAALLVLLGRRSRRGRGKSS